MLNIRRKTIPKKLNLTPTIESKQKEGNLMTKEKRFTGQVGFNVYLYYI